MLSARGWVLCAAVRFRVPPNDPLGSPTGNGSTSDWGFSPVSCQTMLAHTDMESARFVTPMHVGNGHDVLGVLQVSALACRSHAGRIA